MDVIYIYIHIYDFDIVFRVFLEFTSKLLKVLVNCFKQAKTSFSLGICKHTHCGSGCPKLQPFHFTAPFLCLSLRFYSIRKLKVSIFLRCV